MSMDRSPITGTSFPQILPRNGDELTTFRDNFRSSSFQRPRKQLPPPTSAVKLDYITKTPHAVKDTYISTTRIDFPLLQSSPQLSKQTAQESNRSSLDHFSLETDRRLTNQTSTSSSEYSCKVLQFQPPRDRTGNAMQLSKTDFLGSRVKKWANAGSEYSTSFAKPSLEARHRLDQQNDAIAIGHHTNNQRSLVTTSMLTYRGEQIVPDDNPVSCKNRLLHATYSSIPFGDNRATVVLKRSDYNPPNIQSLPYNKSNASRAIYNSSWAIQEGWTNQPVTINDKHLYYHQMADKYPKLAESNLYRERNLSSLPQGDCDTDRDSRRRSDLTSRRYHSKPPQDSYSNYNVSRSKQQQSNVSNIPLGSSSLKHCPLPMTTLTGDSYKPLNEKLVEHVRAPPKDNIHLDYCPHGYLTCSATRESFPKRDVQEIRLKVNPAALKNLKKTHWELPKMTGQTTYVTTNQLDYTVPRVV